MRPLRISIVVAALALSQSVRADVEQLGNGFPSSPALEALFAEAQINWERSLSGERNHPQGQDTRLSRLPHLLDVAPEASLPGLPLSAGQFSVVNAPFSLPPANDPFDPFARPTSFAMVSTPQIMEVPAHLYFRTSGPTQPTDRMTPPPGDWITVEANNPLLGAKTLRSLRQIGFATIAPIPEPGLPALTGLALLGALFHRGRPSRP